MEKLSEKLYIGPERRNITVNLKTQFDQDVEGLVKRVLAEKVPIEKIALRKCSTDYNERLVVAVRQRIAGIQAFIMEQCSITESDFASTVASTPSTSCADQPLDKSLNGPERLPTSIEKNRCMFSIDREFSEQADYWNALAAKGKMEKIKQNVLLSLIQNPEKLWTLYQMYKDGGEPMLLDVDTENAVFIFGETAPDGAIDREKCVIDREAMEWLCEETGQQRETNAEDMAASIGATIMSSQTFGCIEKTDIGRKMRQLNSNSCTWLKPSANDRASGKGLVSFSKQFKTFDGKPYTQGGYIGSVPAYRKFRPRFELRIPCGKDLEPQQKDSLLASVNAKFLTLKEKSKTLQNADWEVIKAALASRPGTLSFLAEMEGEKSFLDMLEYLNRQEIIRAQYEEMQLMAFRSVKKGDTVFRVSDSAKFIVDDVVRYPEDGELMFIVVESYGNYDQEKNSQGLKNRMILKADSFMVRENLDENSQALYMTAERYEVLKFRKGQIVKRRYKPEAESNNVDNIGEISAVYRNKDGVVDCLGVDVYKSPGNWAPTGNWIGRWRPATQLEQEEFEANPKSEKFMWIQKRQ